MKKLNKIGLAIALFLGMNSMAQEVSQYGAFKFQNLNALAAKNGPHFYFNAGSSASSNDATLFVLKTGRGDGFSKPLFNIVNGSGSKFYIYGNGNVGIGTAVPGAHRLNIVGTGTTTTQLINGYGTTSGIHFKNYGADGDSRTKTASIGMTGNYLKINNSGSFTSNHFVMDVNGNIGLGVGNTFGNKLSVQGTSNFNGKMTLNGDFQVAGDIKFSDGTSISTAANLGTFQVLNNTAYYTNSVSIGSDVAPAGSKLYVNGNTFVEGKVHAREMKVTATGWADYVFDENYELKSLDEVQSFIDANHHLPDVPSAKVVEEEGINLAEMNKIMMRKIEELTLYILEQQKEIEALKATVNQ